MTTPLSESASVILNVLTSTASGISDQTTVREKCKKCTCSKCCRCSTSLSRLPSCSASSELNHSLVMFRSTVPPHPDDRSPATVLLLHSCYSLIFQSRGLTPVSEIWKMKSFWTDQSQIISDLCAFSFRFKRRQQEALRWEMRICGLNSEEREEKEEKDPLGVNCSEISENIYGSGRLLQPTHRLDEHCDKTLKLWNGMVLAGRVYLNMDLEVDVIPPVHLVLQINVCQILGVLCEDVLEHAPAHLVHGTWTPSSCFVVFLHFFTSSPGDASKWCPSRDRKRGTNVSSLSQKFARSESAHTKRKRIQLPSFSLGHISGTRFEVHFL